MSTAGKLKSRDEAAAILAQWKAEGHKVVFTNGCFDILHAGHVDYLEASRQLGDKLVLGLNSDESVRRLKGPSRPICDESARARLLCALEFIDMVVLFEEDTPTELISALRPSILVKGADWKGKQLPGSHLVDKVEFMPFQEGWSTTNLVERIRELIADGKL
jgi:D-beta-D-heptose 7-phosphate kinase/D-beta-D-heptose 1-phosphate adenosyltransferase